MKNSRAFTLIELLVVVLIIGILAAVAMPAYNKAVAKARYRSVLPTLKALQGATERYVMTNRFPFHDDGNIIDRLDVSVPEDPGCKYGPYVEMIHGVNTSCKKNSVRYFVGDNSGRPQRATIWAVFGTNSDVIWDRYIVLELGASGMWKMYCANLSYPEICDELKKEFNE